MTNPISPLGEGETLFLLVDKLGNVGMADSKFTHTLTIEPQDQDIDHMGHVNNSVYLRWVQEVVFGHWSRIAPSGVKAEIGWIALSHEISYRQAAFLGDTLEIATRVIHLKGFKAYYATLIRRGGKALVAANSVWGSVDLHTRRIRKLSPQTVEVIFPGGFGGSECPDFGRKSAFLPDKAYLRQ